MFEGETTVHDLDLRALEACVGAVTGVVFLVGIGWAVDQIPAELADVLEHGGVVADAVTPEPAGREPGGDDCGTTGQEGAGLWWMPPEIAALPETLRAHAADDIDAIDAHVGDQGRVLVRSAAHRRVAEPHAIEEQQIVPEVYPFGSEGPAAARQLLQ